jgi:23S rRNA pseudouridine1911/1915/1917 synthase
MTLTPGPPPTGFELIYEAGPCLAVVKPGGLLTQAAPGIDNLETRLRTYLKTRDNKPGNIYLAIVHRLDRPVSGLLLFARNVRAARRLAEQFQSRTVEKRYWAIVSGLVEPAEGTWQDFLRKIPDLPQAEIVDPQHPDGRQAILHYRVVMHLPRATWLEIELETGRMHQIRLQAAARGHPILGDSQYGSSVAFGPQTDDPRERWIALHAWMLRFRHPMTRENVRLVAPPPDVWDELKLPAETIATRLDAS